MATARTAVDSRLGYEEPGLAGGEKAFDPSTWNCDNNCRLPALHLRLDPRGAPLHLRLLDGCGPPRARRGGGSKVRPG
jgi:hypothetical protein